MGAPGFPARRTHNAEAAGSNRGGGRPGVGLDPARPLSGPGIVHAGDRGARARLSTAMASGDADDRFDAGPLAPPGTRGPYQNL